MSRIISVSEYVAALNEEQKQQIADFIEFMNTQYPQLTSKISFSMPMWLVGKKMREGYVAVSAAGNHFSIHFSDEEFLHRLAERLPSCKTGKRCINIRYGDIQSYAIVKESIAGFLGKCGMDGGDADDGKREIGCCGAYCKTCREFLKTCKGCKLGYADGSRGLSRAKCKMKKCCLEKGCNTCAECPEYDCCAALREFFGHSGYKYSRYRQTLVFIRANGYEAFMKAAEDWKCAYGKLQ